MEKVKTFPLLETSIENYLNVRYRQTSSIIDDVFSTMNFFIYHKTVKKFIGVITEL